MKLNILGWRSYVDRFLGELAPIFDDAQEYLEAEGIADAEQAELAKIIIHGWDAYAWIEASVYGRVRRKAIDYDPLRESFRLLSASLVTYGIRQLVPRFELLERAETLEEFSAVLITQNPGSRDLPTGLNALSGLCALMELHRMILRGWNNFHLAGFVRSDLSTLSAEAAKRAELLQARAISARKATKARQEQEWMPRLKRTEQWARRLRASVPRPNLARAISDATGIPMRTVSRHLKKLGV